MGGQRGLPGTGHTGCCLTGHSAALRWGGAHTQLRACPLQGPAENEAVAVRKGMDNSKSCHLRNYTNANMCCNSKTFATR